MSKISNCFNLLELLSSGRTYNTKSLSEILEVKARMIRVYKDELEKAGIYINSIKGKHGGYYLDSDYNFPVRSITKSDVEYLKSFNDQKLNNITSKLETIIINKNLIFTNDYEKDIYNKIYDAILNNNKVEIIYHSSKGSLRKRVIHPLSLYNNSGVWRVEAFCEYKNKMRRFRLLSIKNIRILVDKF
jgi:predicted DNA-binding transcriptional regulator YafY